MAITEIYVDPSIAANSGAGTIGDPYGDLEYAIVQETFDTTNGTRVNIKAGTDEVLAADLATSLDDTSVSVAWAPADHAPLIFQGYTSAAGDGGQGGISGNSTVTILNSSGKNFIAFVDIHLKNSSGGSMINLGAGNAIINCEVSGVGSTAYALQFNANNLVMGCYLHDNTITNSDINMTSGGRVLNSYISTSATGQGILLNTAGTAERNIIDIGATGTDGINMASAWNFSMNNSIYNSTAGTGAGIVVGANQYQAGILNNLIEGFSGTGGDGIDIGSGTSIISYGGNSIYNCSTSVNGDPIARYDFGGTETLSASPFSDAANADFSPVVTGSVKEGSVPSTIANGLV